MKKARVFISLQLHEKIIFPPRRAFLNQPYIPVLLGILERLLLGLALFEVLN